MEGLIWGLLLAAIFFFALYLVARAALRDGIREAREGRGDPPPPRPLEIPRPGNVKMGKSDTCIFLAAVV